MNNKYMFNYDESKESSYIVYLDFNNQYACALPEQIPYLNILKVYQCLRIMYINVYHKLWQKQRFRFYISS